MEAISTKIIYDLKAGDTFQIVSCAEAFCGSYRVDTIIENVAVCTGEAGSKLMLPLHVAMPFAVLTGSGKPAPKSVRAPQSIPVRTAPAAEAPAEEVSAGDLPAEEVPAAEASAEPAPAEALSAVFEPDPIPEPPVRSGSIAYYDAAGHWGKIAHERFRKGLFFYIDQVTDEAFKAQLCALKPGEPYPAYVVNYREIPNPRRPRTVCAGSIELVSTPEIVPAEIAPEGPLTGYLEKYSEGRGTIACPASDAHYKFRLEDVKDHLLEMYLKDYVPYGSMEALNIEVNFMPFRQHYAKQICWKNMEACTDANAQTVAELAGLAEESADEAPTADEAE